MIDRATMSTKTPEASQEASGVVVPSTPPERPRWRRVLDAAMPLVALLALAAIEFPLCPARLMFGVPCPGCGLTRATLAILTLDLEAMWRFHPMAPLMTPIVAWFLSKPILEELGWIPKHRVFVRVPNAVWGTLLVMFFGLYLARLAGLLGGLPDPIDPGASMIGRAWELVAPHVHRAPAIVR